MYKSGKCAPNRVGGATAFKYSGLLNLRMSLLILSVLGQGRAVPNEGISHPSYVRPGPLTHHQEGMTLELPVE